jgi:thioredoxin 1
MAKATPVPVSDGTFDAEVLQAKGPVIADFWAEWCGPCKRIAPVLNELAEEYAGRVKVVKVDVDQNQALAERFRIMSIPTLLFFKDGQVVETVIGAVGKDQLEQKIKARL